MELAEVRCTKLPRHGPLAKLAAHAKLPAHEVYVIRPSTRRQLGGKANFFVCGYRVESVYGRASQGLQGLRAAVSVVR